MRVRNFWVSLHTDGRSTVETGPQAADGGIDMTILQRDGGSVGACPLRIVGKHCGGKLVLTVEHNGAEVYRTSTER